MRAAWGVALALGLAACNPIPLGDGPRKQVLRAVADEVIVPGYDEVASRAGELAIAARAALPGLDAAGLADLQARWKATRVAWMKTQAHRLGPVRDLVFEARIAQWPVDPGAVEALIAGSAPVDRALIDAQGGNKKGLGVAEYLLFAGADPLAALAEPRRRAYLGAVLEAVAAETAALAAAWHDGYDERFLAIGEAGAPFVDIKSGIDALVNAQVFLAENVADGKLGKPLGAQAGGVPQPDLVESPWSDHGAADIVAACDGLALIFEAEEAGVPRLGTLVAERRPAVAARARAELAVLRAAALAMPRPLVDAVAREAPEVDAAWQAARALKMTYQAEVIAALGATLSFNENDGD